LGIATAGGRNGQLHVTERAAKRNGGVDIDDEHQRNNQPPVQLGCGRLSSFKRT
jgi:hypothetical protein